MFKINKLKIFILLVVLVCSAHSVYAFNSSVKRNLDRSTVALVDEDNKLYGTAFAISQNGYLVTNYHVVEDQPEEFIAKFWDGSSLPCHLVSVDESSDLALLQIDSQKVENFIPLEGQIVMNKGEKVATCGFPQEGGKPIRYGKIKNFNGRFESLTQGMRYLDMKLDLTPGMSGSPVVNHNGKLIGIHNHKDDYGHSFAIPITRLARLLDRVSLCYGEKEDLSDCQTQENSKKTPNKELKKQYSFNILNFQKFTGYAVYTGNC